MRSVLICEDFNTTVGLRLAGIDTYLPHTKEEMAKTFQLAKKDKSVGIIILTETVFNCIEDLVSAHKLSGKKPLLVTIPGRKGLQDKNFLLRYVKDSIGIKID